MVCSEYSEDRAQAAWVCKRWVLLDQPDFLPSGDPPSGKGKD